MNSEVLKQCGAVKRAQGLSVTHARLQVMRADTYNKPDPVIKAFPILAHL